MTTPVYIYIAYTIISISMTVWVARTLHKNGRIFLYGPFLLECICLPRSRVNQ